ncbi:Adenylyltransferase and sulfurtransferase MOCS3 [Orobanche hederae]
MNSNEVGETAAEIRREIAALQKAKAEIEGRISVMQAEFSTCSSEDRTNGTNCCSRLLESPSNVQLSADMIHRYCRQLILPSFGVEAQASLLKSSVLVIGAGGLGSPALLYLAACGVDRSKVESAAAACRASMLSLLIPTPPPATACQRCADSGVLGVVPGVIGCLQALEALKVAGEVGEPLSGRMLLFDALSARIRVVKIRGRSPQCEACGENLTLTEEQFRNFDYKDLTQSPLSTFSIEVAPASSRGQNNQQRVQRGKLERRTPYIGEACSSLQDHLSREFLEYGFGKLGRKVVRNSYSLCERGNKTTVTGEASGVPSLFVICRRGNDSQRAVELLTRRGFLLPRISSVGLNRGRKMSILSSRSTNDGSVFIQHKSPGWNSGHLIE